MREDFEYLVIIEFDDVDGLPRTCASEARRASAATSSGVGAPRARLRLRADRLGQTCDRVPRRLRSCAAEPQLSARLPAPRRTPEISRSWAIDAAALIATRRCDPLSSPFVYHEFNARSLLITQRSWPRAGPADAPRTRLPRRDVAEALCLVACTLLLQHVDVGEQKLRAVRVGDDARGAAGREIRGLTEDPRVAERTAADEHA